MYEKKVSGARWKVEVNQVQEIGQMECRSKSEVHRDVPMYTKFKP
jgi:hypothetical protein